jgi:hypothetical protein
MLSGRSLRSWLRLGVELGSSALNSIAVQIIAILTLPPTQYGRFSLTYLIYGLSLSLGLSLVSEPWIRTRHTSHDSECDWDDYSRVAVTLALFSAVAVFGFALWSHPLPLTLTFCFATALSVYRAQARFFAAAIRDRRHVVPADLAGAIAIVAAWALATMWIDRLLALCVAWAVGAIAQVLLSLKPHPPAWKPIRDWFHLRAALVRALLADSMLLDVSSILVPYILTLFMNMADVAVYLAISSMLVPVRLLLTPLRPLFVRRDRQWHTSGYSLFRIGAAGSSLGMACWGVLTLLSHLHIFAQSTFAQAASSFSGAIGFFIAVNFVSTYYYYVSRLYLSGRHLVHLRLMVSGSAAVLPVLCFFEWSLNGAVWGRIVAALLGTVLIILYLRKAPSNPANQ